MSKKSKNSTLATLLETPHPTEQAARVQNLLRIANAPVIDLLIRHDGRNGQTTLYSAGDVSYDTIYAILDMARAVVRAKELESMKLQAMPEAPPTTESPAP